MPQRYSSGHFAAVAFFALVAYIAYSFGSSQTLETIERREADRAARQHSIYADEHIQRACGNLTGGDLVVCAQEQVERSGEYQNAEYDLSAQEQMATFAKWLLWVSVASVGVTGLGLFFVWKTLEQAIASTDAAQEAIEVTRRIGEAELRAYVDIGHIGWVSHTLDDDPSRILWRLNFQIKNSGATPTRGLKVTAIGALSETPELQVVLPDNAKPETLGLGAGASAGVLTFDIMDTDMLLIKQKQRFFFVLIEATYGNAINPKSGHITRIGATISTVTGNPLIGWEAVANPVDLRFSHLRGFNCFDGECKTDGGDQHARPLGAFAT